MCIRDRKITISEAAKAFPATIIDNKTFSFTEASPGFRRKILDRAIFLSDATYSAAWFSYYRTLKQRNKVLKDRELNELDTWSNKLSILGTTLSEKREHFFNQTKDAEYDDKDIKRFFAPEFRNRLDATVVFAKLSKEVLIKIVGKFMLELKNMLKEKSVKLELTNEAIDYLVENGYDSKMGARPMQRLIDDKIKQPLSKELLFGKLKQGGEVKVTANDKGLVLDIPDNVKLLEKQA